MSVALSSLDSRFHRDGGGPRIVMALATAGAMAIMPPQADQRQRRMLGPLETQSYSLRAARPASEMRHRGIASARTALSR